jgi:hypothetical protein
MVGERTMNLKANRSRYATSFVLAALVLGTTPAIAAPPAGPVLVQLPAQELAALRREVAHARARDARPFSEVAKIVTLAPELNAAARARRAPIALYIAKLGPSALLPLLELLAIDPPRGLPEKSAQTMRQELIEAVGLLRNPRALRVLSPILEDAAEDIETTRAAAEAIARVGTDVAADELVAALATSTEDRARAVVSGMGECRRLRVIQAVAERLRTTTDEATARAAIRTLGRAGNAWVWPTIRDRAEELPIRETAARALVEAFIRHEGDVRTAASNALMVVDARETTALIAEAKRTAGPEAANALDALASRFANNPARTSPPR